MRPLWTMYNAETRRHEAIEFEDASGRPGATVVQLCWCRQAQRYVAVPGASRWTVQADGKLARAQEVQ
jgi:hypothetical protein